jgi:hypothetical protein
MNGEKTYPVTKDGIEFEVRAKSPEEAASKAAKIDTATTARVISRDGTTRVFERPNGMRYVVSPGFSSTDPAAVEKAMGGVSAGEISRTNIDESLLAQYPVAARAGEFVRGAPFVGSRLDEALGILGPEATAGARALSGAMQRQRPGETLGLNIAGGITGSLGAGAVAGPQRLAQGVSAIAGTGSRAAQIGRTALAAGGAGAIEGGIYGSGEGVTPEERASSAATGAVFGGTIGGLLGGAAPFVEAGVRNVTSLFRRSDIATIAATFGISTNAARVIKNTFEMGGDINDAISRVQQAGAEGMVADAGPAAQALLDATAASGPSGAAAARQPIEDRMSRVAGQMDTRLTGLLGQPAEGPVTAVSEIMSSTSAARRDAYGKAYSAPIDYASQAGMNIENIVFNRIEPDILMSAINKANAEMRDLGTQNQQIMAQIGANGTVEFVEMPNVLQLDQLKRALDALARGAKRTEGVTTVNTPESLRYARQANDLRDAIEDATIDPATGQSLYGQALKLGGDTIQEREAFGLGMDLLSPSTRVEDVKLGLGAKPSNAQIEAAKRGMRTRIEEIVGNVRRIPSDPNIDARQALAVMREMGSDNARKKIRAVMGAEADDVIKMLDEAMVSAETRAAMSVNSRTAIRQATAQNVEELTSPGAVGQALRGEPINTTKRIIQAVTGYTDEFSVAQRQKVYMDLAKALTEKRGPDAVVALRALDAAMQGQSLTDAQTDMLAKLVTSALVSGSVPALGRETASQFGER